MLSRESHGIQMWTSETAQKCCAWVQDCTKNYIPHNRCAVLLVIQVTGAGASDANGFASSDGFIATWAKRNMLDKFRNLALKWGSRVPGELFSYLWTMLGKRACSGPHTSCHWLLIPASQHNQTTSQLGWLVTSQSHGNVPLCLPDYTVMGSFV